MGDPLLPVQHDQAKDLELYISWSAEDAVQRLLDHFSSRPNAMVERFKKIKVYDPKTGVELDPKTGEEIKRAELRQAPNEPSPACVPIEPDKSKPKTPTAATLEKLRELVNVYDRLVVLLRNEGDERLKAFTDSVDGAITQLKALVAAGTDAKTSREMVAGIRQGLRETPQLLSALVPECSRRLVADIERKLGHRFSDF